MVKMRSFSPYPDPEMSYTDTFILVATDCPATYGEIPQSRGGAETMPMIEHDLLTRRPYHFNEKDLIFEKSIRHRGISPEEVRKNREAIWSELFQKPHPCLRASPLAKRYGWGVHYDHQGRIAIYAVDSKEYAAFRESGTEGPTILPAMRNKRA